MKKILFTIGTLFMASYALAVTLPSAPSLMLEKPISNEKNLLIDDTTSAENKELVNCTVTIKGNFEGQEVDLEITVYDVTWVGCQLLKTAVKAALAGQ